MHFPSKFKDLNQFLNKLNTASNGQSKNYME